MAEHEGRQTEEDKEQGNPVATGLSAGDFLHVGLDGAVDAARGGTEATSWGGLTGHLGDEMAEVMAGDAKLAGTTVASNSILGPAAIAGGIMEMIDAVGEWKRGDKGGAVLSGLGATSSIVGGASSVAALGGSGAAAAVAPLAMSAGAGLKIGRYGDGQTKKLGWFHDEEGNNASASEWAGQKGRAADDWLTERGHPWMGTAAGIGATLGASALGGLAAMGGAAVGGYNTVTGFGRSLGDAAANHHRANTYAGWDTKIAGGAQAMADYDDNKEAAIERSKREHPERWGHNPNNQSYGQWISQLTGQVAQVTHGQKK